MTYKHDMVTLQHQTGIFHCENASKGCHYFPEKKNEIS